MIRVELIDPRGHYIRSMDFQKDLIKVGRSLDCDLIVPDFQFGLEELRISRGPNGYEIQTGDEKQPLKAQHLHRLHGYKIKVIDLAHYAGEKKEESHSRDWMESAFLFVILLAAVLFDEWVWSPFPKESGQVLRDFSAFIGTIVILNLILAFISRAVNGDYRLWAISRTFFHSVLGALFLTSNGLGLRWVLPELFWNESLWNLFILIWGGVCLWMFAKTILDHVSFKIRLSLVGSLVTLITIAVFSGYLPGRETVQYSRLSPKPPLPEFFESPAKEPQRFMNDLNGLFE